MRMDHLHFPHFIEEFKREKIPSQVKRWRNTKEEKERKLLSEGEVVKNNQLKIFEISLFPLSYDFQNTSYTKKETKKKNKTITRRILIF